MWKRSSRGKRTVHKHYKNLKGLRKYEEKEDKPLASTHTFIRETKAQRKEILKKKQERSFRASQGKGNTEQIKENMEPFMVTTLHRSDNTGKGNRRKKTLHQHSQLDDGGGVEALQRHGVGRRLEAGPGAAEGHGLDVLPRRGHVPQADPGATAPRRRRGPGQLRLAGTLGGAGGHGGQQGWYE